MKVLKVILFLFLFTWFIVASASLEEFNRGVTNYNAGNYQKAIEIFTPLVSKGLASHPGAQFYIGLMHEEGKGVARNYAEAISWYRKSADRSNRDAQFRLAKMLQQGRGVKANSAEAANWLQKSAVQGHPQAQFELGLAYEQGNGRGRNDLEAANWYFNSARQGHAQALNRLTNMANRGVPQARLHANQLASLQAERKNSQNQAQATQQKPVQKAPENTNSENVTPPKKQAPQKIANGSNGKLNIGEYKSLIFATLLLLAIGGVIVFLQKKWREKEEQERERQRKENERRKRQQQEEQQRQRQEEQRRQEQQRRSEQQRQGQKQGQNQNRSSGQGASAWDAAFVFFNKHGGLTREKAHDKRAVNRIRNELASKWHPDKNPGNIRTATQNMQKLNNHYDELKKRFS